MDRLTLTLFGFDREQEVAIKELFEARGWDYVHEISLPFLNFTETFLATYDTTVVSVEPETARKGDSCASAINVSAGVDVSHSGQGNEASELDGDRWECVFCFCSLCETCVRQQWLGHGQDAHKRNSRIRKKLCRKCRFMMNMRGAWWHPLYVRKKETAMCRDHIDGIVVISGLYPYPPDTPYLGHRWW